MSGPMCSGQLRDLAFSPTVKRTALTSLVYLFSRPTIIGQSMEERAMEKRDKSYVQRDPLLQERSVGL
jgi:hypothetical protein